MGSAWIPSWLRRPVASGLKKRSGSAVEVGGRNTMRTAGRFFVGCLCFIAACSSSGRGNKSAPGPANGESNQDGGTVAEGGPGQSDAARGDDGSGGGGPGDAAGNASGDAVAGGAEGGADGSMAAGDGGIPPGWPTFEQAAMSPLSSPLLIILLDFSDSDMATFLPNPEPAWSGLMFGTSQGQGNHFFYEVSGAQFQLLKAHETYGQVDNGVIRVKLSEPRPTSGTYVVQDQPWIPEALDKAASFVDFKAYDKDNNGIIENRELAVLFVLNLDYSFINGAGGEANVPINHMIAGSGVALDKFARVQYDYTSVGTPSHELSHQIFGLKHAPAPTEHDLMGLGAYGEDPVITRLHDNSHYATRPTSLTGIQKVLAGLVQATTITDTTRNIQLYSPHTRQYNVIRIPVVDGYVYFDSRTAEGYDQSIPFCNGDTGGIFVTDTAQYLQPLNIPGIASRLAASSYDIPKETLCDFYSFKGHDDSFSIGQFTVTNVSAPGPVMTFDLVRNNVTPVIAKYMYRYWVNDPNMAGYRMWHAVQANPNQTTTIDVSTFPDGTNASGYFTITLEAYYNTGEVRSVNPDTTFTSTSPYVQINPIVLSVNPGAQKADTIIQLQLNQSATYVSSAVVNVTYQGFMSSFTLVNLPKF
jgi:M6 family metalloprotease-like protein